MGCMQTELRFRIVSNMNRNSGSEYTAHDGLRHSQEVSE
jgi:hypothetical protein